MLNLEQPPFDHAKIILGQLIDFPSTQNGTSRIGSGIPGDSTSFSIRFISDGCVAIGQQGRIEWVGEHRDLPSTFRSFPLVDHSPKWIMPGFVDAHIHYPQYRMLASHGESLLDWLNRFTFPEELAFDDPDVSLIAANKFLDQLACVGTTCCLCFSTTHIESVDAIFSVAAKRNMALISGKTLMDRGAPTGLLERSDDYINDCRSLIAKWHGWRRLRYAISPRFAITSTDIQLERCGELAADYPNLIVQTHLSESLAEIEAVKKLFPWARTYTDVYDRFGLVRDHSIFAHGIHLSEAEMERLAERHATIVHCPTSNTFLGSGLFPWKKNQGKHGLRIGLGSDVGAGTSYSMLQNMKEAYSISQLLGNPLSVCDLFGTSTIGNAERLGLANELGTIEVGKFADLIVVDPMASPLLRDRARLSQNLSDELFSLLILGDDRVIAETYIAGQPQKRVNLL